MDVSPEKIKILHCIHSLSGGGAERQLGLLVRAVENDKFENAIFYIDDTGYNKQKKSINLYKGKRSSRYDLSVFTSINNAIKQFKPDVVHAWLPAAITIPAIIMSALNRIPCVYSYRTKMQFYRLLSIPEFIVVFFLSSRLVANNPIIQSSFPYRSLFRYKRGVEIYNAVEVDPIFIRQRRESKKTKVRILYVGRLIPSKNIDCLLKAVAMLDIEASWELTLCGDGEERQKLESYAVELGIEEQVKFTGFVADVYSIMQNSDIMVLPSLYEGMPNVFLEALAIGLPCIVSDIVAHREIVRDTKCALIFDPNAPNDLKNRIENILKDTDQEKLLINSGMNVAKKYTTGTMAGEYMKLYKNIVSKKNAS